MRLNEMVCLGLEQFGGFCEICSEITGRKKIDILAVFRKLGLGAGEIEDLSLDLETRLDVLLDGSLEA